VDISGAIHALTNSPLVADDQTRTQDHRGNETGGVCANYSCDEKKGDKVSATDPFGSTFLMPAIRTRIYSRTALDRLSAHARDVRAMSEYRRRRRLKGVRCKLMLFFGARAGTVTLRTTRESADGFERFPTLRASRSAM
jgi:hypothetical protein